MSIKEYLDLFNLSFSETTVKYKEEYEILFNEELAKNWLVPIENKLDKLKIQFQNPISEVIRVLKSENELFTIQHKDDLSVFTSQIDSVVNVVNRLNNFKEGTELENNSILDLVQLFNYIKNTNSLEEFNFVLNKNLQAFAPHLFSVVKNCQDPINYPIFYKFWNEMSIKVLLHDSGYDSLCQFYRTFPLENRTVAFGSYFAVLANQLVERITDYPKLDVYKTAKYLNDKVINLEKYQIGLKKYLECFSIDISTDLKNVLLKLDYKVFIYFDVLDNIITKFGFEPNNEKYYFNYNKNDLIFTIGQRYIWNVSTLYYRYISLKNKEEVFEEFGKGKGFPDAYLNTIIDIQSTELITNRICEAIPLELKSTVKSGFRKNNKEDFQELVFNKKFRNDVFENLNLKRNQELQTKVLENKMNDLINLLKYKKQIILQGPPGTGKTREAKKLADELIESTSTILDLAKIFKQGQKIESFSGMTSYYDVLEVFKDRITIKNEKAKENRQITKDIILITIQKLQENIIDRSRVNFAYEYALAQYILNNFSFGNPKEQIQLIQFHPSYTYEDFVRGIVSKPNEDGDGIVYEAENKVLAILAKKALDNYLASKNESQKNEKKPVFDAFIESIKDEIAQSELHKFNITDAVYLFSADETRFKYKGDNWVAHNKGLNMKFSELNKIIESRATERQDIKKMAELEELTRQHASYFIKLVEKFYEFEKSYILDIPKTLQTKLKKYVLIIDEINRANLSSVLGELIYALEYRGDVVESMYAIGKDNKLILPPNLYIIGTMNTADRSVGHIDYAIRRRFAFVDILPKDLSTEEGIVFDSILFSQVAKLFEDNLSPEFEMKDVQLGHSYFIDKSKDNGSMDIRLKYEINPILLEYVKDGVLIGENIIEKINGLKTSL